MTPDQISEMYVWVDINEELSLFEIINSYLA